MPLLPFLALTLLLPAVIVISNFVIGVLTPITLYRDDMTLIDPVWRLVQGQHVGTDFHDPRGFGLFQVAAILWRLLGPHYYVLRASADLFALVIVLCGCIVATQQLRRAAGLAALFCITVAFEASGPTVYGSPRDFGMACSYNRLLMSGLLVLFVQSFANDSDSRQERNYIAYFTAAFLLNILFLVKISGLLLGLVIVVGGYIVRGRFSRNLSAISLILLFLAVMVTIVFVITGTSLPPVIQDYRLAAQARTEPHSVLDALWFASGLQILGVVVLTALYAVSRRPDSGENLRRCFFIVAFYWVCQVVLNMTNWPFSHALIILAPAAAVAVVTWTDTPHTVASWDHLWSRFHPRRLHEISAREVIPPLILALVFVPEALASLRAVKLVSISSGNAKPIVTVTANKGITFDVLDAYGNALALSSLNRVIQEIEVLRASHEKIANLDYVNPFPALFLAPAPKGVSVFWAFGFNVPIGYRPSWQEIIGDACIITEPKHSVDPTPTLIDAVKPHLTSAFTLVYEDERWKIWKHNGGCVDDPHEDHGLSEYIDTLAY
jgi:hypothetical protein